ncbi:MAG TPA: adenylyltransferase, partial [Desulfobacteraceae bacterium]|nr:adenylyltransferase [Desulfobacteraceae bacterium]
QAMTVIPGQSACLCCLYKEPERKTDRPLIPVIGVTPGVIGSVQAAEAIKFIIGRGNLLTNRLLRYDGLAMTFHDFGINPRPGCSHCRSFTEGGTP